MNSRTNKPGMAGYSAAMKKTFTEEERFYREIWVPNLIKRRCAKCTWTEFCAKLYEVLWSEIAGWESIPYILDKLYKISGICGIVVATQAGFRSFEEMLHSNDLAHVVNIESSHKPDHPDTSPEFVKYKYRAVMDPNHFQDIRRRVKQRRPCLTAPITSVIYPPERPKVRNVKNRDGEIISYEVDEDEQQLYEDELRSSQEKSDANIEQGEIEDEYNGKPCSSKETKTSKIVNDFSELKLGKKMNESSKYYDDDDDYGAGSSTSKW